VLAAFALWPAVVLLHSRSDLLSVERASVASGRMPALLLSYGATWLSSCIASHSALLTPFVPAQVDANGQPTVPLVADKVAARVESFVTTVLNSE
jgi:hypothetical protein